MTSLQEIGKLNGLTLKGIATASKINYTTLSSLSKKDSINWKDDQKKSIAKTLQLTVKELEEELNGNLLTPFIKWVGGKRQLLPELIKRLPKNGFNTYYEPFIGGGALFLRIKPKNAFINDFNSELTNTWKSVRDNFPELSKKLFNHQDKDSKEYYLNLRSVDRDGRITKMSDVERAARFIYLNKAGYNGLWRVNSKGQNNVPYGSHTKLNLVPDTLSNDAEFLKDNNIKITNLDYKKAVENAQKGDFVYFDPPYIPVNDSSYFTSYTPNGFGLIQQEQLRDLALQLANKGVNVMLSNSDVPLINELYNNPKFHIHRVKASRFINSNAKKRGKVGEVIITTY